MGDIIQFPTENDEQEEASFSDDSMRRGMMMSARRIEREIKKNTAEREHWKAESEANNRKKLTCMACLIVALGDDVIDVIGALVSFGLLESVTFFIPGMLRMFIAAQERTPSQDSFMRSILAMAIEAIPVINVLPTTTINVIIDLVQAEMERAHAQNEFEKREKTIKKLNGQIRQLGRTAQRLPHAA